MSKAKNDRADDFTTGSIPKKLFRFMIPILGALILQAMYGAVDLLVVGHFGTDEGITAVATGSNMINLVTFLVSGLAMGVTVLIGRYIGEKKNERVGSVIGGAVCFFIALALVLTIVVVAGAGMFVHIMQVPEESVELTTLYVRICGAGLLFIVAYNVISSVFRGLGNSKLPFLFVLIACIVNVVGDLLFVAVFQMNVAGAALATILAQAVSVVLSLVILKGQELPFTVTKKDIRFNREIQNFFMIGLPIALQDLLTNLTFLAINAFINSLGYEAASGYGVANKVISFIMLIPSSLMQSMAAFVAQNVGAKKEDRAKHAMFLGMGVGGAIGVIIALFVFFRGDLPSMLFTGNESFIANSASYLKGFSLEAVITCILFSYLGYLNGHERTKFVMFQGLAQSLLIRLPVSYLMSIKENTTLFQIGLAVPASTIFGIVLCTVYFLKMQKEQK